MYPAEYFLKTETSSIKISSNSNFEADEFALVITLQPLSKVKYIPSDEPQILNILNKIGYDKLSQKFSYYISGNFLGDPPWGYYQIAFASQSPSRDGLLATTRIHSQDEMTTTEGGTDGQIATMASQILSTFRFIDTNSQEKSNKETSNWQTYSNEQSHYQIQYPPDWNIIENPKDDPKASENTTKLEHLKWEYIHLNFC
jgi:hypothetical protein